MRQLLGRAPLPCFGNALREVRARTSGGRTGLAGAAVGGKQAQCRTETCNVGALTNGPHGQSMKDRLPHAACYIAQRLVRFAVLERYLQVYGCVARARLSSGRLLSPDLIVLAYHRK